MSKKVQNVSSQSKIIFFPNRSSGMSKNPEFYADLRSEGIFGKNCTRKKLDPKTVSPVTWEFLRFKSNF
jgi:hypothetical protein